MRTSNKFNKDQFYIYQETLDEYRSIKHSTIPMFEFLDDSGFDFLRDAEHFQ